MIILAHMIVIVAVLIFVVALFQDEQGRGILGCLVLIAILFGTLWAIDVVVKYWGPNP